MKRPVFQKFFLILVQVKVIGVSYEVLGGQKESARPAGRIGDQLARFGTPSFDHGPNEGARREILAGAGLGVLSVLFK